VIGTVVLVDASAPNGHIDMALGITRDGTIQRVIVTENADERAILVDELEEMNISAAELARTIGVPPNRISQNVAGKRAISADTALRLGRHFRMEADFWMNLQKIYDLDLARRELGSTIKHIPQRPNTPLQESA
jgi:addiction module HigA family antidote